MYTIIYIYENPVYNYTGTANQTELNELKSNHYIIQDGNIVTVYMDQKRGIIHDKGNHRKQGKQIFTVPDHMENLRNLLQ